jgi:hypothetical protein
VLIRPEPSAPVPFHTALPLRFSISSSLFVMGWMWPRPKGCAAWARRDGPPAKRAPASVRIGDAQQAER